MLVGDINIEGVKSWADKDGDNLRVARMDVTTEDGWKNGVKECVDTFGRIDVLVNNAGWTYKNKVSRQHSSLHGEISCSPCVANTRCYAR